MQKSAEHRPADGAELCCAVWSRAGCTVVVRAEGVRPERLCFSPRARRPAGAWPTSPPPSCQVLRQSGVLTVQRIGSWGGLLSLGRWGPWVPSSTSAPGPSSLAPYLRRVAWHRPLWACGPDGLCPESLYPPGASSVLPKCVQTSPGHKITPMRIAGRDQALRNFFLGS